MKINDRVRIVSGMDSGKTGVIVKIDNESHLNHKIKLDDKSDIDLLMESVFGVNTVAFAADELEVLN